VLGQTNYESVLIIKSETWAEHELTFCILASRPHRGAQWMERVFFLVDEQRMGHSEGSTTRHIRPRHGQLNVCSCFWSMNRGTRHGNWMNSCVGKRWTIRRLRLNGWTVADQMKRWTVMDQINRWTEGGCSQQAAKRMNVGDEWYSVVG